MLSYAERATHCRNPAAINLLRLMTDKQSNLALSADVTTKNELLTIADLLGPHICVLKTHIDILDDFDLDTVPKLLDLATRHRFLIFEDRKFADIGHTVQLQYAKGIYRIAQWAAITNAHSLPGPAIIEGLQRIGLPLGNGLLLIAQMSSAGNLAKEDYTAQVVQMAESYPDFVIGFISQQKLVDDPKFIHMTPGVQLQAAKDDLGQQYTTPWQAIFEQQNDIIIVGRGIYKATDPVAVAKEYQAAGWHAYQSRVNDSLVNAN